MGDNTRTSRYADRRINNLPCRCGAPQDRSLRTDIDVPACVFYGHNADISYWVIRSCSIWVALGDSHLFLQEFSPPVQAPDDQLPDLLSWHQLTALWVALWTRFRTRSSDLARSPPPWSAEGFCACGYFPDSGRSSCLGGPPFRFRYCLGSGSFD